jgi:hypothetical protein
MASPSPAADAATTLTQLHVEAFKLIAEALRIPEPAITDEDGRQYDRLSQRRGDAIWVLTNKLSQLTHPEDVREAIEMFQARIDHLPVLYTPHDPELAKQVRS